MNFSLLVEIFRSQLLWRYDLKIIRSGQRANKFGLLRWLRSSDLNPQGANLQIGIRESEDSRPDGAMI